MQNGLYVTYRCNCGDHDKCNGIARENGQIYPCSCKCHEDAIIVGIPAILCHEWVNYPTPGHDTQCSLCGTKFHLTDEKNLTPTQAAKLQNATYVHTDR